MNNLLKYASLAVFVGATGVAQADTAETKGGIKVKTEDGRFEANVGGRIHFDAYIYGDLETGGVKGTSPNGTTEFRRARITLSGKAYGWEYKFEEDFAGSGAASTSTTTVCSSTGTAAAPCPAGTATVLTGASSSTVTARDMFVATKIGPGKLTIGQFKPYRSMEELTSSNEITMLERPFTSASGIFNGRQFQQGLGYLVSGETYTLGASGFSVKDDAGVRNEGLGFATRGTYTPINSNDMVVHLGLSYSVENRNGGTGGLASSAALAGRRSPSTSLGSVATSKDATAIGVETAMVLGPIYAQAEYMMMTLGQAPGTDDQDVTAYYVMGSYHVTGESKGYKKGTGVFGSAKPNSASGAVELTARYDFADNSDLLGAAGNPEVTAMTVGVNYYFNPNVRMMLNYVMGESEVGIGTRTKTELDQISLRTQFAF